MTRDDALIRLVCASESANVPNARYDLMTTDHIIARAYRILNELECHGVTFDDPANWTTSEETE